MVVLRWVFLKAGVIAGIIIGIFGLAVALAPHTITGPASANAAVSDAGGIVIVLALLGAAAGFVFLVEQIEGRDVVREVEPPLELPAKRGDQALAA